jgi:hypothetical protein
VLYDASAYGDGSKCKQNPVFDIFSKSRQVELVVYKPKHLNHSFEVFGSGEMNFNLAVSSSQPAPWLKVYRNTSASLPLPSSIPFSLSSAKTEFTIELTLGIFGDLLWLPDGGHTSGAIQVAYFGQSDSLSVKLDVRAFASCQRSHWSMSSSMPAAIAFHNADTLEVASTSAAFFLTGQHACSW